MFISEAVIIGTMLILEAYEKSSMGTQTDFEICDIVKLPILPSANISFLYSVFSL